MSGITRRRVLRGGALIGAGAAMPALARQGARPALAVYDSRIPEARAFAADARARRIPVHDIAGEDAAFWARSRGLRLHPARSSPA